MKSIIIIFVWIFGFQANAINVSFPLVSESKQDSKNTYHQFMIYPSEDRKDYVFVHFRSFCHKAEMMYCSGTSTQRLEWLKLVSSKSLELVNDEQVKVTIRARSTGEKPSQFVQEFIVLRDGKETVYKTMR